jgi:hypothetical protein
VNVTEICDLLLQFVYQLESLLGGAHLDAYPIVHPLQHPAEQSAATSSDSSPGSSSWLPGGDLAASAECWALVDSSAVRSADASAAAAAASAAAGCTVKHLRKIAKMFGAPALARHQQALGILLLVGARLCPVPLQAHALVATKAAQDAAGDSNRVDDKPSGGAAQAERAGALPAFVSSRLVSAAAYACTVSARFLDPKYAIDTAPTATAPATAPAATATSSEAASSGVQAHTSSTPSAPRTIVHVDASLGSDIGFLTASACAGADGARTGGVAPVTTSAPDAAADTMDAQKRTRCCYRFAALMTSAHSLMAANQSCRQSQVDNDRRYRIVVVNITHF